MNIIRHLRRVHQGFILHNSTEWSRRQQGDTWIKFNLRCLRIIQIHWEDSQAGRSNRIQGNRLQRINDQLWKENKLIRFECRTRHQQLARAREMILYRINKATFIQPTRLVVALMSALARDNKAKRTSAAEAQCIEGISRLLTTRRLKATEAIEENTIKHLNTTKQHLL